MSTRLDSVTFEIDGTRIAGIRHHDPHQQDATRLLCVHGWLDNANSFIPMMPFLPQLDLVAIDLPGHGYSDHLSGGYSIADMVYWVVAIAQKLHWPDWHLLGHSLGANIALLTAVSLSEQTNSLILIESSGPMTEQATQFADRLQRALADRLHASKFQSRLFQDKQQAVDARLRAAAMAPASARLIIDRQTKQADDGWRWRFDPKLRMASSVYLTEDHVRSVLTSIRCPTLTIIASDGFPASRDDTEARLCLLQDRQAVEIHGHHHLHMDTPEPVCAAVNRFLGTRPALGG